MMLRFNLVCACFVAVAAVLVADASAQGTRQGGTGGFNAQGNGLGSLGLGQGGFGTTGFGTTNSQTGRIGTGTNNGLGGNSNALGGLNSFNNMGATGLGSTNSGFSQSSGQFGQQGTTGTNTQGMTQQNGVGTGRNTGLGNNNQFGNLFQNQIRTQAAFGANPLFNNQQRRSTGGVQPSLRLGFAVPERPMLDIEQEVESRLQATAARPAMAYEPKLGIEGVKVDVETGGVVRLTGSVANDAARRRAANVIRLEPGVKKVINDLTVAEAAK